jgi:Domain of unknown function (DUF4345)
VLQLLLIALGAIAFIAGASTVVLGATSVVGIDDPSPAVDSEMRFFAAWYAAAGVLLVRAARQVEINGTLIRGVSVTVFIAGCARALSWMAVGKPPAMAIVLMGIELALPFVIIPLQVIAERKGAIGY